MEDKSLNLVDGGIDSFEDGSDPQIKQAREIMRREAANSQHETAWALRGMPFAWSNLPQQLEEVEGMVRGLMVSGKFGPKYIRDYVLSCGYGNKQFMEAFSSLTGGISFEEYMNSTNTIASTPGNIPAINLGCGPSKSNKYEYLFIMPFGLGYEVFGQVSDTQREEVSYHLTLGSAREWLKDNTTESTYFDKPVPLEMIGLPKSKNPLQGHEVDNGIFSQPKHVISADKNIKAKLIQAYKEKKVTAKDFLSAWAELGFDRHAEPDIQSLTPSGETNPNAKAEEKVRELYDREIAKPVEETDKLRTPSDFFDDQESATSSVSIAIPPEVIEEINLYLKAKKDELTDFDFEALNTVYKKVDNSSLEKPINIPGDNQKDFFSAYAYVAVSLKVIDKTLPSPRNSKTANLVFMVLDSEIVSNDVFKGVDKKLHGFTETGLTEYFFSERQTASRNPERV